MFNRVISRAMIIGALGEGLYLLFKYGLIIIAVLYALNYSNNTRIMGEAGANAALALNKLIEKGYLPRPLPNGEFPVKPEIAKAEVDKVASPNR